MLSVNGKERILGNYGRDDGPCIDTNKIAVGGAVSVPVQKYNWADTKQI